MNQNPDFWSAVVLAWKGKKRVFAFSISLIAALAVGSVLTEILIGESMQIPWIAERMSIDLGYFAAFLLQLVVVFLFTRPVLGLLRESQIPPTAGLSRPAILLGVVAITAQTACLLLLNQVSLSAVFHPKTIVGYLVIEAILSLIGASPYILLFIGLSLLAAGDSTIATTEDPEPVDGLCPP